MSPFMMLSMLRSIIKNFINLKSTNLTQPYSLSITIVNTITIFVYTLSPRKFSKAFLVNNIFVKIFPHLTAMLLVCGKLERDVLQCLLLSVGFICVHILASNGNHSCNCCLDNTVYMI